MSYDLVSNRKRKSNRVEISAASVVMLLVLVVACFLVPSSPFECGGTAGAYATLCE